jgi:uncharacterized membrane protein
VSDSTTSRRPLALGLALIIGSVIGWWAAFQLTLDKIATLSNPDAALDCNVSVLVQCSANLNSAQGSVFGFPNPLLGLTGWGIVFALGWALLAGAQFSDWMWRLINLGMLGALSLVIFLITTSIYFLGTLCPWCMLTWSVTIPLFLAVTFRNMRMGVFGRGLQGVGRVGSNWIVIVVLVVFLLIALLAQFRLDWVGSELHI